MSWIMIYMLYWILWYLFATRAVEKGDLELEGDIGVKWCATLMSFLTYGMTHFAYTLLFV